MAQTYTLEEASQRLGIPAEEFKRRLRDDWKTVRSFRDGATLRFRAADIDELARALGQASDPGVTLGEAPTPLSDSSEELAIDPPPKSGKKGKAADAPLFLADDSDDIFALPAQDAGKGKAKGVKGDSDVRLDLTPSKKDATGNQPTEELDLDLPAPASGVGLGKSSSKLTPPKSSGRMTPPKIKTPDADSVEGDGSSEFELSLDSDSDSFELQLTNDSSEEVPLGGEVSSGKSSGQSGINLGKPSDSGVSIEKKKKAKTVDDSDGDFELSLDGPGNGAKSGKKLPAEEEGSSEFELTLDDSSGSESMNSLAASERAQGDIFETDFELPVMGGDDESGSEVVPVDSSDTDLENSDFDLAISDADAAGDDDSASQVVLMDDEGEEAPQPGRKPKRLVGGDDDDVVAAVADDDEPIRTVAAAPPKWGILPALLLTPTFVLVILGGIMAFELVRGMAGYQQPGAASAPLVRGMAGMFGFKTAD